MNAADVVGYALDGELYCPDCIPKGCKECNDLDENNVCASNCSGYGPNPHFADGDHDDEGEVCSGCGEYIIWPLSPDEVGPKELASRYYAGQGDPLYALVSTGRVTHDAEWSASRAAQGYQEGSIHRERLLWLAEWCKDEHDPTECIICAADGEDERPLTYRS